MLVASQAKLTVVTFGVLDADSQSMLEPPDTETGCAI